MQKRERERLLADAAGRRAGPVLRVACNVPGGTLGVFFFPPHFQFCSAAITGRSERGGGGGGDGNNYNFLAYAD